MRTLAHRTRVRRRRRGRSGKLLIFRFTPRATWRPRLATTRSRLSTSSASNASWKAGRARGGNSHGQGQFPANDAHRMDIGHAIGIDADRQRGLMHQAADGEMRQEKAVKLLTDQIGRFLLRSTILAPR